jgi:hypothetical protein
MSVAVCRATAVVVSFVAAGDDVFGKVERDID